MTERLQKYLAHLGLGSRREIEDWIRTGRVFVDGTMATLGCKVDDNSQITVDEVNIFRSSVASARPRVLVYHKPEGEICSRNDPGGRPTVFRHLPVLNKARWISVGRLDFNTSGLLLFTTDGGLAHRLMHPSFDLDREYLCRVYGGASEAQISQLKKGILLDGELCRFEKVCLRQGSSKNRWYEVVVREGRYREIRRLWEAVNCNVSRLVRIRYGPITLPRDVSPGNFRELEGAELANLLKFGE